MLATSQTLPDELARHSDKHRLPPKFTLPGAEDRLAVIGATGTGKTVFGAWVLSRQRFDKRAWVAIDFKNEVLWDMVGTPPMRKLKLGKMPDKRGLHRMQVLPGQDDALEAWLWDIWKRGNVGLFVDEVSLMPKQNAFKAILRQGRSKHIPVIACSQRPVDVDREVFSEANYISVFRLDDIRDYKIIQGFTRNAPIDRPLRPFHSFYYDKGQYHTFPLKPSPPPATVAASLKDVIPRKVSIFG